MGVNTTALGDLLKTQLEGLSIGEVVEGRRRIPVQIGGGGRHSSAPASIPALEKRVLLLPDGNSATLGDVASVAYAEGPVLIEREQGNRFGLVSLNVNDRDVVSVVEDIRETLEHGDFLPPGYTLSYGGDFENQRRASRTLVLVVPFALGLIALILFATLGSISRAVLIIANLPFALMGGVIALYLAGEYLSVPASVGLIALLGISVLNGVVMLGHMDQQIRSSRSLEELVVGAARDRLRPVLMTATTAMIGLFPLVFASGPGAEIQRPLAVVVIGGLVTATLTTLYLLPVVYHRLEARHGS
jgi:cobalt-zinc-cadmium resistance protein CzcA